MENGATLEKIQLSRVSQEARYINIGIFNEIMDRRMKSMKTGQDKSKSLILT